MFNIYGGATEFKQWELDKFVTNPCMKEGDEVVFRNSHGETYVVKAFAQNGEILADVPNYLLKTADNILVDLEQGNDRHPECRTTFTVVAQAKPDGYECKYNVPDRPAKGGIVELPFGKETTTVTEVLAECQPVFNNTMQGCLIGHGQEMALAVGETYIVTMDGKEYTTIPAVDMTTMGDERMWVGLINEGANLETGEGLVFMVMSFVPEFAAGVKCPGMVRTLDGSVPSTISIRQEVTTVSKISGKYVEGMGWSEKTAKEELAETTVTEDLFAADGGDSGEVFAKIDIPALVLGDKYTVTFDDTVYELECFVDLETPTIGAPFGDWSSYPFAINSDSGFQYLCLPKAGTHTISIRHEAETIHPIDQKFLPSGGGEFVVTFTVDSDNGEAVTCDKSFDEIVNAYNSGCKMMGYMIREGVKSNLPSIRCSFDSETRQWCDFSGFVVWSDPAVWFYSIQYNRESGQEEMVYSNITYPEGFD